MNTLNVKSSKVTWGKFRSECIVLKIFIHIISCPIITYL